MEVVHACAIIYIHVCIEPYDATASLVREKKSQNVHKVTY